MNYEWEFTTSSSEVKALVSKTITERPIKPVINEGLLGQFKMQKCDQMSVDNILLLDAFSKNCENR